MQFFKRLKTKAVDHKQQQTRLLLGLSLPAILVAFFSLLYVGLNIYLLAFFSIIALLGLFYVVYATRNNIDKQQQLISNLLAALIEEDYTMRGNLQQDAAIAPLLKLINTLADNLQTKSRQVSEKQILIDKILDQVQAMCFAYDNEQNIVMVNHAAHTQLFLGQKLEACSLQDFHWMRSLTEKNSAVVTLNTTHLQGEYFVFKDKYLSAGTPHMLLLLIKAEQILDERKQQAWQDLLRVLSHELNNSLTPIATISRSLNKKIQQCEFEKQPQFQQGLEIISERASSLQAFITSYRELAQLPKPSKSAVTVQSLFAPILPLFDCEFTYSENWPKRASQLVLNVDKKQLQQVLINLIKNAIEANTVNNQQGIELDLEDSDDMLKISIRDFGQGIANFDNLFVPFYTTKHQGTGLGLALSRQIVLNHDGQLQLENHSEQGAIATVTLPVLQRDDE